VDKDSLEDLSLKEDKKNNNQEEFRNGNVLRWGVSDAKQLCCDE